MKFGEASSERKIFILVSILFLNLLLISTNVVLKNKKTLFGTIISNIISPFQVACQVSVDFISHQFKHYVFLKDSFSKYYHLKKQYSRLKYENYLLKRRLGEQEFPNNITIDSKTYIKAEVISVDPNFPLNSIMINRGSKDGIVENMSVLNALGELVGRTVEPITYFSSKVRMITSSIGGVGAYIENNKLEGFLTGNNSTICSFKYLIENKPVFKGDRIVTSGTDRIFPPYIPIGRVISTQKDYLTLIIDVKPFFIEKPIKNLIIIKSVSNE
jgi:rod shape-determining protein MreC